MVDELRFEDNASPWEAYKQDPERYLEWAEEKKGEQRVTYPFVTGTGMTMLPGERVPEGKKTMIKKQDKLEPTR